MKILIVICALLCAIESRPLESIGDINREDLKNLLKELNINADELLPRLTNMITAPMHCDNGYQYYGGKCRRVYSVSIQPYVFNAQQSPQIVPAAETAAVQAEQQQPNIQN